MVRFFYQGWNKGGDEDGLRENISEEDTPPWFYMQEKQFPRSRQGFLYENIMNKLGMTQRVIRERSLLFFIVFCCCCVTHPFPEYRSTNGFRITMK